MVRITYDDFKKLVKLLEKEAGGTHLTFKDTTAALTVSCTDRTNKEMVIEISDVSYPFMPRVTKTETF